MRPLEITWKCAGWRGGWLEHPFRVDVQHLLGGTSGLCTTEQGGASGELGKAGLGLMALYKPVFWRAAYHVRDYWHVKPAQTIKK